MFSLLSLTLVLGTLCVFAQEPKPCKTPGVMHFRVNQFDHGRDLYNKYNVSYDAPNKRVVFFERQNVIIPGKRFYEYLTLSNLNVMYTINQVTKECTKSVPAPWTPFEIPPKAIFEDEFYIGGPQEVLLAQEWSDRIPHRASAKYYGVFSLKNCYPISDVIVNRDNVTTSIVMNFFDITETVDPKDFDVPPECQSAKWGEHTVLHEYLFR